VRQHYTEIVLRACLLALVLSTGMRAQQQVKPQEPPEEDESLKTKEYAFNPLQASKEVKVGDYYFKKRNYKAAALRFREATRWNPGFAEAFLKLGESEEKLNDRAAAKDAYAKYLDLNPSAKDADAIRKKLTGKP
jgi:tetratricopeptide (TPR) repeat protein